MSVPQTSASFTEVVWYVRHALHSSGYHYVSGVNGEALSGHHDSFHTWKEREGGGGGGRERKGGGRVIVT